MGVGGGWGGRSAGAGGAGEVRAARGAAAITPPHRSAAGRGLGVPNLGGHEPGAPAPNPSPSRGSGPELANFEV